MSTVAPGMQAEFRLRAVGPPLDRHVAGIWAVSGAVPVTAETVLPNGVVELIFNLGPPHRVVDGHGGDATGDRWYRRAWLAGMQQGPLTIASQGHTDLVGVRFRPGGAAAVFGLSLAAITDAVVELDQLDVVDGSLGLLWHRLLAADIDTRVALVTSALVHRTRARTNRRRPDHRVEAAIGHLPTAPSLAALADHVGMSHKHLITRFHEDVGVTPSRLRRILRFHRLVRRLDGDADPDWAALAPEHGFSDQSHLVREFRALAGVTPTQFLRTRMAGEPHLDASHLLPRGSPGPR